MLNLARNIVLGVAGVGAVGAGVYTTTTPSPQGEDVTVERLDNDGASRGKATGEVCLKGDLPFIAGDQSGCHARSDFSQWRKRPINDPSSGELRMTMSSPRDASMPTKEVRTCREFSERKYDGWFAMTSRDMRREAFFVRACGVIEMLAKSRTADVSYFENDTVSTGDVATISADQFVRLGSDPATTPGNPDIEKTGAGAWRVSVSGQTSYFNEIAALDFDEDGILEILAFFSAGPDAATARISQLVLLEKDTMDVQVSVTPLTFSQQGVAGG